MPERRDRHHILWSRKEWTKGKGALKELRGYWYFEVYVPREALHECIHGAVPDGIPPLSEDSAKKVYRHLVEDDEELRLGKDDSISERIKYLITLISTYCKDGEETIEALCRELDAVCSITEERSPA